VEEAACQQHSFPSRHKWWGFSEQILLNCSVAISADSDNELLEAAVQHAVSVHQHTDSAELRTQLQALFRDGTPPVDTPAQA